MTAAAIAKFEDFKNSLEYKLWGHLKQMLDDYEITESKLIDIKDLSDYWEPLLDRLYKLGVCFNIKQVKKIKEIKMDWIRPIFIVGTELTLKVDGGVYEPPKESCQGAEAVYRNLRHIVANIHKYGELALKTYKPIRKELVGACKEFFKYLVNYATKRPGWRDLYENIKMMLFPIRAMRKPGYRLFIIESKERADEEMTQLEDKEAIKKMIENTKEHFKFEAIKVKRDNDLESFNEFLNRNDTKGAYQYSYEHKVKEGYQYTEINKIKKEVIEKDFENGINTFLLYLYEKLPEQFPDRIDVAKLFRNFKTYKDNELEPVKFYLDQMKQVFYELKVMCYEMKMNGLSRIKIPCSANIPLIERVKQLYDLHVIVENIMGDKLKYDQYIFMYNNIKFIYDSTAKEELSVYKEKIFMEDSLPKYIILQSMRKSAAILEKMRGKTKADGEFFNNKQYYQLEEMPIDIPEKIVINAYTISDDLKPLYNPGVQEIMDKFEAEKLLYDGRFWLFEGFFNAEERAVWLEAVDLLRNINNLVQDDIRDYILLHHQQHFKDGLLNNSNINNSMMGQRSSSRRRSSSKKLQSGKSLKGVKPTDNLVRKGKQKGTLKNNKKLDLERSFDSEDESVLTNRQKMPLKLDGLRPPEVWNFPIDKLKKLMKEEDKFEIRVVDPRDFYKDGRVKDYLDMLEKIKFKMMEHCAGKLPHNIWKFLLDKTLAIFSRHN
jgi:hypothetical protein